VHPQNCHEAMQELWTKLSGQPYLTTTHSQCTAPRWQTCSQDLLVYHLIWTGVKDDNFTDSIYLPWTSLDTVQRSAKPHESQSRPKGLLEALEFLIQNGIRMGCNNPL
jgi:hypothetical protein